MKWNIDSALGVLITQIGGRKHKALPISKIASAASYSVKELGSSQAVASAIGRPTARAQISDFVVIDSLPNEVKSNFLDRGLIGIEVASELSRLNSGMRIREVAKAVLNLRARDAMQVIAYAKRHPGFTALKCRARVLGSKNFTKRLDVLLIPIERPEFERLSFIAKQRGMQVPELAGEIVSKWVKSLRT